MNLRENTALYHAQCVDQLLSTVTNTPDKGTSEQSGFIWLMVSRVLLTNFAAETHKQWTGKWKVLNSSNQKSGTERQIGSKGPYSPPGHTLEPTSPS